MKIIKIGGNVVDNEEILNKFLTNYAKIEGPKILVHGGGKIATKISAALGIETQMIEGRRVSDAETVKVVTMVYAGLVNKTVVSKLQALEVNAIGLSGADGNAIQSHKRPLKNGVDYGFVGDVDTVNSTLLSNLFEQGYSPVMAPITHDKKGLLLNTNADTIASTVAVAMSEHFEVELCYCFELPGVMKDIKDANSLISSINTTQYKSLKNDGVIADGMIPKMDNCFDAINSGVNKVRICHADNIHGTLGTTLMK